MYQQILCIYQFSSVSNLADLTKVVLKRVLTSQAWWFMPVIPALKRLKQKIASSRPP
jgi:hypothetical protein